MSEEQIKSILNANAYLIKCKTDTCCRKKLDRARKYLNLKINQVLANKKRKTTPSVVFLIISFLLGLN